MASPSYYFIPLSREEAKNGKNLGYKFAMEHQDRWYSVDPEFALEFNTNFDRGTEYMVLNGIVYTLHKDYLDPANNRRLYIVKEMDLESDRYEPST